MNSVLNQVVLPNEDVDITINLGPDSRDGITDFQASAKVFFSNDRSAKPSELKNAYRLSTKIIDDKLYTRLDFEVDEESVVRARSVITNPSGTVVFDSLSGTVEQRLPPDPAVSEGLDMAGRTLFQKMNIPMLKEKMTSLNYDITEEETEYSDNVVVFTSPSALLPDSAHSGGEVTSFKLMFDTDLGAQVGSEQVEVQEDGTVITTSVEKFYYEEGDTVIPVGDRLAVHYDYPYTIAVDDSAFPIVEDEESLPTLSDEELEELNEDGAYEEINPLLGDPADPNYTDTWLTVYETVSTNSLEIRMFLEVE